MLDARNFEKGRMRGGGGQFSALLESEGCGQAKKPKAEYYLYSNP